LSKQPNMILHLERKFVLPSETFIMNQINGLTAYRHAVFTVKHIQAEREINAQVYQPDTNSSSWTLKFISRRAIQYFRKTASALSPNVVHSHYITDAAYFHAFTKELNIPKVCSCYGYDVTKFPKQYGALARLYYKPVFKEYDLFLAMSPNMHENLLAIGCPAEKIKIHYHGVDTKIFQVERTYTVRKPVYNILTVGQIDPTKGHMTVLGALKILKEKNPAVKLQYVVVGEGPLRNDMERYIEKNNLYDVVVFKGFVKHGPELNKIMTEADVFVHPCITANGAVEGIPGAIVEAMASGLPVISTFHGGIPGVITSGENGILINENDVDALADKLLELYKDEEQKRRLGTNARQHAQDSLDLKSRCDALAQVYTSLIA
jgi:colanic acid/amylovoran biosynthesis glycosyltransferase